MEVKGEVTVSVLIPVRVVVSFKITEASLETALAYPDDALDYAELTAVTEQSRALIEIERVWQDEGVMDQLREAVRLALEKQDV